MCAIAFMSKTTTHIWFFKSSEFKLEAREGNHTRHAFDRIPQIHTIESLQFPFVRIFFSIVLNWMDACSEVGPLLNDFNIFCTVQWNATYLNHHCRLKSFIALDFRITVGFCFSTKRIKWMWRLCIRWLTIDQCGHPSKYGWIFFWCGIEAWSHHPYKMELCQIFYSIIVLNVHSPLFSHSLQIFSKKNTSIHVFF